MSSSRSWLLALIGVAVLIVLVLLVMKVRDTPATEVDAIKLKEAQANYRRQQAAAERARPTLPDAPPVLSPRARGAAAEAADEVEAPPVGRRSQVDRRDPARLHLNAPVGLSRARAVGAAGDSGGHGLKGQMDSVNRLYDRANYEDARDSAIEVLEEHPKQVRMLRVVVSTSCIMGDEEIAAKYFDQLERDRDRRQMARRCARYGVELDE